jgi:nucleoside-diphosphate-sugar epimerase
LRQPHAISQAFVTGGTGFVGSHLVRHLVESGDRVAVLLRPESDPWRIADVMDQVECVVGRLSEPAGLAEALSRCKPDVVYHLGWSDSTPSSRDDRLRQQTNVADAASLVQLAADAGVTTWVGLGSQAEYGPTRDVLDESTHTRPTTEYGAAKLEAGRLTRDLCAPKSIRHVWLRLVTAYGPADHPAYFIPHVILSLLRGRRPALTEGSQPGDFLNVTDACNAVRIAALTDSCAGSYVLASGDHRAVREVALTIRDMIDPRLEIGLGDVVPDRAPFGLRGDPTALENATGWSPKISLESGLARSVDWYRRNLGRYSDEQSR